jgi:hypothetical protein
MTIRRVIVRTVRGYRRNARSLLLLGVALFVPLGLIEALTESARELRLERLDDLDPVVLVPALAIAALSILGQVFYSGAVAAILAEEAGGERRPLREVARRLPYGALVAVDLVFTFAFALGLALLVVPGLVFFAWFALAGPLVGVEHDGVRAAFARSRNISRGHGRTIVAVLLPVLLLTSALSDAIVGAAPGLLGSTFAGTWLGGAAANVALSPFYAVAATLMTTELAAARPPAAAPPSPGDG